MGYAKPYPKPEKQVRLSERGYFEVHDLAKTISKLAKRKFIPKRSKKRAEQEKIYNARVKVWIVGKKCVVFTKEKATQNHHRKGRWGKLLLDERYWLPVSDAGHKYIHAHPEWAREKGFMIPRSV